MAQTGYTPISIYHSTTASAAPTAGNLANGELAININDGKLYYKDSGGVVQVIATKAGASGDVVGPASSVGNNIVLFDGTTGKLVKDGGQALPTGTIVGTSDSQTLTNKTISADNNTLSGIAASSFVLSNASGNIDGSAAQKVIPAGTVVGTTDSQTLTNKTISVDDNTVSGIAASSFVLSNSSGNIDGAASQKAIPSGTVVGTTDTQTLSSKRIDPRAVAASGTSGTLTINGDTTDLYLATGLTGGITFAQPSGTPVDGQKLIIRIKDNGTARGITWTTSAGAFRAVGITLPTTTVLGKVTYVGCVYNLADSFWDSVATVTQA